MKWSLIRDFRNSFNPRNKLNKFIVDDDDDVMEFERDATCSELSSLFHRVIDVCTAEFELIAHVFGSAAKRTSGNNEPIEPCCNVPFRIPRMVSKRS